MSSDPPPERQRIHRSGSVTPSVAAARELSRSQYLVGTAMLLAVVVMWISVSLFPPSLEVKRTS